MDHARQSWRGSGLWGELTLLRSRARDVKTRLFLLSGNLLLCWKPKKAGIDGNDHGGQRHEHGAGGGDQRDPRTASEIRHHVGVMRAVSFVTAATWTRALVITLV